MATPDLHVSGRTSTCMPLCLASTGTRQRRQSAQQWRSVAMADTGVTSDDVTRLVVQRSVCRLKAWSAKDF